MTIFEAYNSTKKKLEKCGIEDYIFEAKQIIKHITGLSATEILAHYNRPLTEFQENNLVALVHQREVRYPLQYIFGEWDFYGRSYYVGPGVLVPRADTEILAEQCIKMLKDTENAEILDLCAGSGCIGITLALEIKNSIVSLVEKYDEASRYLEKNILRNKAENAKFIKGDIFEGVASDKKYDLIVSNPPYVSDMSEISPETTFEPETALKAEDEGLEFYKAITEIYKNSLKPNGKLVFEVGINQANKVADIMKAEGFEDITITKDLSGIDRVVSAVRKMEVD